MYSQVGLIVSQLLISETEILPCQVINNTCILFQNAKKRENPLTIHWLLPLITKKLTRVEELSPERSQRDAKIFKHKQKSKLIFPW